MPIEPSIEILMKDISNRTESFGKVIKFPKDNNRITNLVGSKVITEFDVVGFFKSTRPVVHSEVLKLIRHFLEVKTMFGSGVERAFYQGITPLALVTRLFSCRPVAFFGADDEYLLRDGSSGLGGFESVGRDNERWSLLLKDYLSYDEMKLSSLLGVSSPTVFLNDGNRSNCDRTMETGTFENHGVIVGLVGCRFERAGLMEYHEMVAHSSQNVLAKGFGSDEAAALAAGATKQSIELNKMWANFYDVPFFSLFADVADNTNYESCPNGSYFNLTAYLKRIEISAETLLLEANLRAAAIGKRAFVYVVGLGLGDWALEGFITRFHQLYLDGFGVVLGRLKLSHIGAVAFSDIAGDIHNISPKNPNLNIFLTKQNPSVKLEAEYVDMLLVVTYAWDGNAFPGNEYWIGDLHKSGGSAAACYSLISELQNPMINPFISGRYAKILDPEHDDI